jgi:hypothetical protein
MEVLVTVKAYPSVSTKYGEAICVAGIRVAVVRDDASRRSRSDATATPGTERSDPATPDAHRSPHRAAHTLLARPSASALVTSALPLGVLQTSDPRSRNKRGSGSLTSIGPTILGDPNAGATSAPSAVTNATSRRETGSAPRSRASRRSSAKPSAASAPARDVQAHPRCTSGKAGQGRGACTRLTPPGRAACSPPRRVRPGSDRRRCLVLPA